jgi:predicted RNase H-like nuclease (RuvC/YqgF family)
MKQEIQDLKKMIELLRKENKSLGSEIEKYKVQILSHVKYESRLLELLKEYEADTIIPLPKIEGGNDSRSIDQLTDDEINELIEKNRKTKA